MEFFLNIEIFEITKDYLPNSGYEYSSAKFQGTSIGVMEVIPIDLAKQYRLARELEKLSSELKFLHQIIMR